jgi:hypothetical protein
MILALLLCILFFLAKAVESRMKAANEAIPLKHLIKDTLLVFLCVLLAKPILSLVKPMLHVDNVTPVFIGNPDF